MHPPVSTLQIIEEMISMQEPVLQVIRLVCLQSVTDAGIKASKYDFLKREIVQVRSMPRLQSGTLRFPQCADRLMFAGRNVCSAYSIQPLPSAFTHDG